MPPASAAPGGEPEPTTWATLMAGADGTTRPTLILHAGTGIRVAVGAEVLDVDRRDLVDQGWGIGLADVPVVAGWSVLLRGGRFTGIRRAGGSGD